MNRLALLPLAALAAGVLAAVPDPAAGCAAVPHRDQQVYTAEEAALIVWDEKNKVEHFVRRATFRSTGYDFGFLVPTPGRPDLEVADDTLFNELSVITAPRIEYREVVKEVPKEFSLGCAAAKRTMEFAGLAQEVPGARAGGVDVLEQKRVGDYDAAVLAFRKGDGDDPQKGAAELAKWLAKHGYEAPPAVEKWLQKYVADGWCVTAFKIAAPESKKDGPPAPPPPGRVNDLRARPIRMSFKADRPFYPYREPETELAGQPEPRLLRVFFVSSMRFAGKLGDGSKPWPGQTVWSGPPSAGMAGAAGAPPPGGARWDGMFQKAALVAPPGKDRPKVAIPNPRDDYWLTEFEDHSSPRPGTDEVYFAPSEDPFPVARPPRIVTSVSTVVVTPWWHAAVYFGVPAALLLGGLAVWRLTRRA